MTPKIGEIPADCVDYEYTGLKRFGHRETLALVVLL
jgi:hypothetical protein